MKKSISILLLSATVSLFAVKSLSELPQAEWIDLVEEKTSLSGSLYSSNIGRFTAFEGGAKGFYLITSEVSNPIGYQGPTRLGIKLNQALEIEKIDMLETTETKSFVKRIVRKGFLDTFIGKKISDDFNVKFISGATMSSKAMKISIQETIRQFLPIMEALQNNENLEENKIQKL